MSIEITGPRAYAFQDNVLVWFFLAHFDAAELQILVEPAGHEDGEVTFRDHSWTVEIQSKSGGEDLDQNILCEWLWHFPPHSDMNALIHRLLHDVNRSVLFVTGRRCMDSVRKLVSDGLDVVRARKAMRQEDLQHLLAAIPHVRSSAEPSDLEVKRQRARKEFDLSIENVESIANRIFVVEMWDEHRLLHEMRALLRKRRIPDALTDDVLARMSTSIRGHARTTDVVPTLRDIVHQNAQSLILTAQEEDTYVSRGVEEGLRQHLLGRRVLLLTGRSQCGKSLVAKKIAFGLQEDGVEFGQSGLQEASQFLLGGSTESRVFLLEDHFEDAQQAGSSPRALERLRRLVQDLATRPGRMLVVTARSDSLRSLFDARGQPPTIDGQDWVDLTLRDVNSCAQIWTHHARLAGLPKTQVDAYTSHLLSQGPGELVQPGQLRHLARNAPSAECAPDELDRVARFNANDLAAYAREKPREFRTSLLALAASATQRLGIETAHLAFILSSDENRPGRVEGEMGAIFMGGRRTEPTFPSYPQAFQLSREEEEALYELECLGWIDRSEGRVLFSHPDYREAARRFLAAMPSSERERVLDLVDRSLGSLSKEAAIAGVQALFTLATALQDDEGQRRLSEAALLALRSIFPSVRDEGLSFLLPRIERLPKPAQEIVWERVCYIESGATVNWHEGEPWLSADRSMRWHDLIAKPSVPVTRIQSPREAWLALHDRPTWEVVDACLRFKEAFIRRRAARAYMAVIDDGCIKVWQRILNDQPSVIVGALEGAIKAWPGYSTGMKKRISEDFLSAFSDETNLVAAMRTMATFDTYLDNEATADPSRWELWVGLAPAFLHAWPSNHSGLSFDSKIFYLVQTAARCLGAQKLLPVCLAWLNAIEEILQKSLPVEEALAIGEHLLPMVSGGSQEDLALVRRLLEHRDTGFTCVSLTCVLKQWNNLGRDERSIVVGLLTGARADRPWLQAVVLTSPSPPPELVAHIVGREDFFSLDAPTALGLLQPQMLRYCLNMYFGDPQPLWWLALHHRGDAVWERIAAELRMASGHEMFDFLWRQALGDPNSTTEEWGRLCQASNEVLADRLFSLLFAATKEVNRDYRINWRWLWDVASLGQKARWIDAVVNEIESVCYFRDLVETFPPGLREDVLERLPNDILALTLASRLTPDGADREQALEDLGSMFSRGGRLPRMFWTFDSVMSRLEEDVPAEEKLLASIGAARDAWFDKRRASRNVREASLTAQDWVYASDVK